MAAPMQEKFTTLTPALYKYLVAHNPPPDAVLSDLAAETAALGPISVMPTHPPKAAPAMAFCVAAITRASANDVLAQVKLPAVDVEESRPLTCPAFTPNTSCLTVQAL